MLMQIYESEIWNTLAWWILCREVWYWSASRMALSSRILMCSRLPHLVTNASSHFHQTDWRGYCFGARISPVAIRTSEPVWFVRLRIKKHSTSKRQTLHTRKTPPVLPSKWWETLPFPRGHFRLLRSFSGPGCRSFFEWGPGWNGRKYTVFTGGYT